MPDNLLYYGDNLDILRRYIKDESVDLIYLDPPFNSNANYNVLFAEQDGTRAAAQIKAFGDTWTWDQAAATAYQETVLAGGKVSDALQAFRLVVGESNMLAYLAMMAPRLVELRRVLKPTGSIYLHCDPTASHYLKLLMDAIFSPNCFRNEIVWQRTSAHSDAKQGAKHFGRIQDVVLFYTKSDTYTWNPQHVELEEQYVKVHYPYVEVETGRRYGLWDITGPGGAAKGNPFYEVFGISKYWRYSKARMDEKITQGRIIQPSKGAIPREKRYLDESSGVPLGTIWTDIPPINSQARERLGYPTQKPEPLLERIIQTSSEPGQVVLDPFCGCGTAIAVAQKLNRQWIGIDITHLAIALMKHRLATAFEGKVSYRVLGEPVSLHDARDLAASDPYQFQWWSLGLVGARPADQKKGSDKGIDGRLYFSDESDQTKIKQVILSVKGGNTNVTHVRDLRGVIEREKAQIGVLITMQDPTQPMRTEAASAGFYHSPGWNQDYPRLQVLTIAELLNGKSIAMPPQQQVNVTFKKAPRARTDQGQALQLPLG